MFLVSIRLYRFSFYPSVCGTNVPSVEETSAVADLFATHATGRLNSTDYTLLQLRKSIPLYMRFDGIAKFLTGVGRVSIIEFYRPLQNGQITEGGVRLCCKIDSVWK